MTEYDNFTSNGKENDTDFKRQVFQRI